MDFRRRAIKKLAQWRDQEGRKPLILRGARQVGKTTLVRAFARGFRHRILLNLEKPKDKRFFEQYEDVPTLVSALCLAHQIPTNHLRETLLFIDEIQESPKAIQMLRYFYEEQPELHVIAAGSLLEFAMQAVKSFPVGRVQYLYLHPLNFAEFLDALGHQSALAQINQVPIADFAHDTLLDLFNQYATLGGMPEAAKVYLREKNMAAVPKTYESIWSTYRDDVAKYAHNAAERKVIKHIMNTAPLYLDQRIKFQHFGNSNYRSREVGEAMRMLDDAKVIRLVYPTTDLSHPIKPDLKKSPRLQFLDTGLVNHALQIQPEMLALRDMSQAHRGAVIPHLITQELISIHDQTSYQPNFWVREKHQSSSEVDLVYAYQGLVIPIEVKSGSVGKLKSLIQFVERAAHPYAVRIYGGSFAVERLQTPSGKPFFLMNLPYYLGTMLPEYIAHLVGNYEL